MQISKARVEVDVNSARLVLKEAVAPFGIGVSENAAQANGQTPGCVVAGQPGDIDNFREERRLRTGAGGFCDSAKIVLGNGAVDFEVGIVQKSALLPKAKEAPHIDAL